jgi:uncharacterized phiE125 gp8 family phage protein
MKSLALVTAQPTDVSPWLVEPITLADARLHLKLDASGSPASHPDDELVRALMQAAREWCEDYTRRAFVQRTVRLNLDRFPEYIGDIELWSPPVASVTGITYLDEDGASQTLATSVYTVDLDVLPPRITLKLGQAWPATADLPQAVKVTYLAGYAPTTSPADYRANVPASVKAAMKLIIGDLYQNREAQAAMQLYENRAAKALLSPLKVWGF